MTGRSARPLYGDAATASTRPEIRLVETWFDRMTSRFATAGFSTEPRAASSVAVCTRLLVIST